MTVAIATLAGASSASASTTRTAPGTPRDVTARPGSNSATLTFLAPATNGAAAITRYSIEVFPVHAPGAISRVCATTRCVVRGLADTTTYYFRVAAITRLGVGAYSSASNKVTPTGPASAPRDVRSVAGVDSAIIRFRAPHPKTPTDLRANCISPASWVASGGGRKRW